jgi:NAD(P)-dependent dehydrogenase (short-subunit alcohol dehydrogenase family)
MESCILITGASSGIGRAIAVQLSKENRLIVHGRDPGRLEETRDKCLDSARHVLWPQDLTDEEQVGASLARLVAERRLVVSGFVHCAGILKLIPLRSSDLPLTRQVMKVNFVSALEIVRALLRKKVNQEQLRSVVFISSISSRFGARGFGIYSASKAALDSLMKTLAVELAPAVRVNSILSGAIRTPMTEQVFANPDLATRFEHDYPLGIGEPADVAQMTEFLLSRKSKWVTGQEIVLDGGRSIDISM